MGLQVSLEQFTIPEDQVGPEKKDFLDRCAKRVHEALIINCGVVPAFNPALAEDRSPIEMHAYGSREVDAEFEPGHWCYVEGLHARAGITLHPLCADRTHFSFVYQGQKFKINYGSKPVPETPSPKRRRR